MASRKSVVEIDVQDDKWKAFAAAFSKFSKQAKEATIDTGAAAAAQAKLNTEKKKGADAAKATEKVAKTERVDKEKAAKQEAEAVKKKRLEAERAEADRKRVRAEDIKHLKESAKWTADVARNVASTAFSAAKWVAFSAIASGFGLGGLGASASGARRQAQGLGINTGQLRAANVNFGRFIDPEAALGNIASAQSDRSKQWIFNALGENTAGKSAGQILPEILPKLVAAFKAGGSTLQGADARGLTQLVSIEDLKRMSESSEELAKAVESYKRDSVGLNTEDGVGRAWQDFMTDLHRAGEGIEVSLIKGLRTLLPFLEDFTKGIAKAVESFASSGGLQRWIESVGSALQKLGNYLGSKEFASDVDSFMAAIHTVATYLGKLFPKSPVAAEMAQGTASSMPGTGDTKHGTAEGMSAAMGIYRAVWDHLTGNTPLAVRNHNPGNLRVPGSSTEFQKFGSDDDGIRGLARQLALYENRDGLKTIRGIISKYAPGNENNTAAYIQNVSKRTGFGADQQLDPTNTEQLIKLILAITKQENSGSAFTEGGVRVVIENQTGGSAQTTVAAMTR